MAQVPVLPEDDDNRALLANVHPPDWRNPRPRRRYHLVVVGAGTAGLVTAAGAAGLGARVALVERHLLGGDCLNYGCVPSKAILRSARAVGELQAAPALGVGDASAAAGVDFAAVMARMRRLRARLSANDSVQRFSAEKGVDVFLGTARFIAPDRIAVGDHTLRFGRAVIATGTRPAAPPIPGLAEVGFLTNETVFSLTERPARLAVIGGGPIGCELAQAFQRLGAAVTLIHDLDHLLPREDPDAAALVHEALARDGVRLLRSATTVAAHREGAEKVLRVHVAGVEHEVRVDEILVGAGRLPNLADLDLARAGVAHEARGVRVDDHLRTTNRRVFAAGDVCLDWKFTHAADAAARIVIQNALFFGRKRVSALHMPWCTYTDPEIAHVGLSEREAAARGVPIDTYRRPLSEVDRAVLDGEEHGFVKVHAQAGTARIVGATIVARHAGDLISEITLAMHAKVGLGALATIIHPYPTQADAIRQIGDLYNRTRLTPTVQRLLRMLLALR